MPNEIFDCSKELHHACQAAVTLKTVHTLVMLSISVYIYAISDPTFEIMLYLQFQH